MNKLPLRILLADDHTMFREGMVQLLRQQPGLEVVAEASNGESMVKQARHWLPDIILADINMPGMDGIEATRIIKKEFPMIHIIALSMLDEMEIIDEMLQAGAQGYLMKNSGKVELKKAIDAVITDNQYLCAETANKLSEESKKITPARGESILTAREIEVLRLICRGYNNAQVSDMLCRSIRTVQGHRERIRIKTGSKNLAGLMLYARRNGLIDMDL